MTRMASPSVFKKIFFTLNSSGYGPLVLLGAATILNGITWFLTRYLFAHEDPAAILHYTDVLGIDFIGEGSQIMVLPFSGSLLLILNALAGGLLYKSEPRAAWTLWSITPILQVLLLAAFYFLWQINQ